MHEQITWSPAYSVGIQVIDEQHQHLIEIINHLSDKVESTIGEIPVTEFFSEVVNYGDYHFQTEERYFSRYDYPERVDHLLAHKSYKDALTTLLVSEGDSRTKAEKLLEFLHTWWVEHITGIDQTLRDLAAKDAKAIMKLGKGELGRSFVFTLTLPIQYRPKAARPSSESA